VPWFDSVVNSISDSEWCGRFREDLVIDGSFRGWMRAFRGLVAGAAGRMVVFMLAVLVIVVLILRGLG
jgi:hypothetical protein